MEKLLMVGVGEVGRYVLEFFARSEAPVELVAGDVDGTRAEAAVNQAIYGANHHGQHPRIRAVTIDLKNEDQTAELIRKVKPSVVINCAVLQTWHTIRRLPNPIFEKLSSATLGAWLPVQLSLAGRLGKALKASGEKAYYVNASLSDLTNPVLHRAGLNPTVGVGNVDLIVPAVQALAAKELQIPTTHVEISLVAHHIHWVYPREPGYKDGAPFHLRILADGTDVTDKFDLAQIMIDAVRSYPSGTGFTSVSASSTLKIALALALNRAIDTHAPGPNGLMGGYPVHIDGSGVRLRLPDGITEEKAIDLNERAGQHDGIERIDPNGTVHFRDDTVQIMQEVLGFNCQEFSFHEVDHLAQEQITKYKALEKKHMRNVSI